MSNYLISGTSRGLGLEIAQRLVNLPISCVNLIFATARSKPSQALQALIEKSPGRVIYIYLDPINLIGVQPALPIIEKDIAGAGLDVLINNVGATSYIHGGIHTMNDLTDVFNTNVLSAHNVTSVFIPLINAGKQKKVLNISTTLGSLAMAPIYTISPNPSYKISKAALNMLTVQYALAYVDKGFIIFSLSPGWIKTDFGGAAADLTVQQSAKAMLDVLHSADKEVNCKFYNFLVKGWEENSGLNQYTGGVIPW